MSSLKIIFLIMMLFACFYLVLWAFHGFGMPSDCACCDSSSFDCLKDRFEKYPALSCKVAHPKEYCG